MLAWYSVELVLMQPERRRTSSGGQEAGEVAVPSFNRRAWRRNQSLKLDKAPSHVAELLLTHRRYATHPGLGRLRVSCASRLAM